MGDRTWVLIKNQINMSEIITLLKQFQGTLRDII